MSDTVTTTERKRFRNFIVGAAVVGLTASFSIGWQIGQAHHDSPDWTVASCSEWGPDLTGTATLPAYTYTDRCADGGAVIFPKNLDTVEDFGQ